MILHRGIAFFALLSLLSSISFAQTEQTYDASDPELGFNLVSFVDNKPDEFLDYKLAIEELADVGARHVNIVVFRRLNANGTINDETGSSMLTIARSILFAQQKNIKVSLTPIFETQEGSGWRGAWNPSGQVRQNFLGSYGWHLIRLAWIAQRCDIEKLNVGSELRAFVNNPMNESYCSFLLRLSGWFFNGQLGYNANWDNLDSPQVERIFWDSPKITKLSVSMYPYMQLASFEESDQSHLDPVGFANLVQSRWKAIVENELLSYAATLKNGRGMPAIIGEFGAVPYNRSAATPADFQPSDEVDVKEQEAVLMGLIRAVDQKGDALPEITLWQWGIGDISDKFGINSFRGDPELQSTAQVIDAYLDTRE